MTIHKLLGAIIIAVVLAIGGFLAYQLYVTYQAHTTFERYYAFRGCVQLIDRTATYGDCKLADGSVIKIVLIQGKWYLNGDGPGIW